MIKPYNPISRFLTFIHQLGEQIQDQLYSLSELSREEAMNMYVVADYKTNQIFLCSKDELPLNLPSMKLEKFEADIFYKDEVLDWEKLYQFALILMPEGRFAYEEFSKANESYNIWMSKPHDEIEDSFEYRRAIIRVDKVCSKLMELSEDIVHEEEIYQAIKKVLLRQKYGIDWKTDLELSGQAEYTAPKPLRDFSSFRNDIEFEYERQVINDELGSLFREDRKSMFYWDSIYTCCERIVEVLFAVKFERPNK